VRIKGKLNFSGADKYNFFLGDSAGYYNSSGSQNTFIGTEAGNYNSTGYSNVFLGTWAGEANNLGNNNTFLGRAAGAYNTEGSSNVFLGKNSGLKNSTGSGNVFLGNLSGYDNVTGDSSIFIGYNAGRYETASYRLYIENSAANSDNALIYGEFDNKVLAFNASVGIGTITPDKKLHVVGDARIEGDIYYGTGSDLYTKPDFVFTKEYRNYLEPLKVDEFIKTNGHLPWITKAINEEEGINLTRMQFETVETVENLQLQIIEMKKEHQKEIENLRAELVEIKELLKKN
jgi:hypothetical protein